MVNLICMRQACAPLTVGLFWDNLILTKNYSIKVFKQRHLDEVCEKILYGIYLCTFYHPPPPHHPPPPPYTPHSYTVFKNSIIYLIHLLGKFSVSYTFVVFNYILGCPQKCFFYFRRNTEFFEKHMEFRGNPCVFAYGIPYVT